MKYIKTFEAYQSYTDYQNPEKTWGTPQDLKEDAILALKRLLPTFDEKWINKVTDQSTDQGIKFEFKIGRDTVHMYKVGNFRGQWEFYLNKKKTDSTKLKDYLESKYLKDLDKFLKYAPSYDHTAAYIDDGGSYKKSTNTNKFILNLFDNLSSGDQKKALRKVKDKYLKDILLKKNKV